MTVRWRTVIPLSSALISFLITFNIVTQLPTDSLDQDDIEERDGRDLQQNSKLFPDNDDDENKHEGKRKGTDVERRRAKALLLFSEEDDDQDADEMAEPDDKPPPDDNRDTRRVDVEKPRQQQHELEMVDEKVENNEPADIMKREYPKDQRDDADGDLLPINNARQDDVVADQDFNDHNDRVLTRDSRPNVNKRPLLENVRDVGAIVQQLKRRPADNEEENNLQAWAPVNPHPFSYVINCPQLCSDVDALFLIVYVHTATGHHKRRTVIRQTWGEVSQYDVSVRIVFVMGVDAAARAQDTQTALAFEAERYQDIVQVTQN